MITTTDIQALIGLAVINNKQGLIDAMNKAGYAVTKPISDERLFQQTSDVYTQKGLGAITKILSDVKVDKDKLSYRQKAALAYKFKGITPESKSGWFENTLQTIGDFFGGSSTITQGPVVSTQQSKTALPPWMIITTAVLAIIGIIIVFAKGVKGAGTISIAIAIVAIGVILYGALGKNIVVTQTGSGTTQETHGSILSWMGNWFNNVTISGVGK